MTNVQTPSFVEQNPKRLLNLDGNEEIQAGSCFKMRERANEHRGLLKNVGFSNNYFE